MQKRILPALAALTLVSTGLLTAPSANADLPKCVSALHGDTARAADNTYWLCDAPTGWHRIDPHNCGVTGHGCDLNGHVRTDIQGH